MDTIVYTVNATRDPPTRARKNNNGRTQIEESEKVPRSIISIQKDKAKPKRRFRKACCKP
jgi:hypothetical protein